MAITANNSRQRRQTRDGLSRQGRGGSVSDRCRRGPRIGRRRASDTAQTRVRSTPIRVSDCGGGGSSRHPHRAWLGVIPTGVFQVVLALPLLHLAAIKRWPLSDSLTSARIYGPNFSLTSGRSLHHHREDARQHAGNEGARTRKRRNEA